MPVLHGEEEKARLEKRALGARASKAVYGEHCQTSGGRRYVHGVRTLMEDTIIRMMEGKPDGRIHLNDGVVHRLVVMILKVYMQGPYMLPYGCLNRRKQINSHCCCCCFII